MQRLKWYGFTPSLPSIFRLSYLIYGWLSYIMKKLWRLNILIVLIFRNVVSNVFYIITIYISLNTKKLRRLHCSLNTHCISTIIIVRIQKKKIDIKRIYCPKPNLFTRLPNEITLDIIGRVGFNDPFGLINCKLRYINFYQSLSY